MSTRTDERTRQPIQTVELADRGNGSDRAAPVERVPDTTRDAAAHDTGAMYGSSRLQRLMRPPEPPNDIARYGFAIGAVLLSVGVAWLMDAADIARGQFAVVVVAIVVATWYGGFRAGLLATIVALALVDVVLLDESLVPHAPRREDAIAIVVFVASAVIVGTLYDAARSATRRSEELAEVREELLHEVLESEEALRVRAEDLRKANAAKDEFLGLISHELRTPITTILGNAQVLRRRIATLSDEDRADALHDIADEAERLNRIVDNLLVLARLEGGQELEMEPMLVRRLVHVLVADHQRRHAGREIVVREDETALPVLGASAYIEQVLRNLLSNAEKYSPPGAPIEVEIEVAADRSQVMVCVLDRGIGIDDEDAQQLFSAFYRSSRVRGVAGAGIGLAVCKRLIEAQGGTIWGRPREGGGSEFGFALPTGSEDGAGYD